MAGKRGGEERDLVAALADDAVVDHDAVEVHVGLRVAALPFVVDLRSERHWICSHRLPVRTCESLRFASQLSAPTSFTVVV